MKASIGACLLSLLFTSCSTTERQITHLVEQMAAHPIGSAAWQQATDELAAIGRPAARQLIALLNPDHYRGENYREFRDEQEMLRTGSARALGRIKPRGATGALKDRITSAYTDDERIACIWAIGEIGQGGEDALEKQLQDADAAIRLHAAIALLKMDDDSGYGEIEGAVAGGDDGLARIALDGLLEARHSGVPLLTRLLAAGGGPRRQALAQVSRQLGERLLAQLESEDPEWRRRAAIALGQLGDASHAGALRARLADPSNQVRFSAAAALAGMGQDAGIDFLFAALRDRDPILRTHAVAFLAEVQRNTGAVEAQLKEALASAEPLTRAGAAQVLGAARVSSAIAALQKAAADPVAAVRANAAIALGQLGDLASRGRLQALLDDDDATVAYYAEWALRQLGSS